MKRIYGFMLQVVLAGTLVLMFSAWATALVYFFYVGVQLARLQFQI